MSIMMLLPLPRQTRASRFHDRGFHLGLFSWRSMQELLNDAAKAGDLPELLRRADPNLGMTALMNAASNNHHAIVQKLLDTRADVNQQGKYRCAFPGPFGALAAAAGWSPIAPCLRRQADSAALCGEHGLHQIRRGAARRRRRPDHHDLLQGWHNRVRCAAHSHMAAHRSARIGAGGRLANQQKCVTSSPSTTRRWRRCGRRTALRAPWVHAVHATHAPPQHGMPRPRSSAYAEAPTA